MQPPTEPTPATPPSRGDEEDLYRRHHRDLQHAVAHAVTAPRELIEDACQNAWAQVGHQDSKVTLQIYARVLKRRDRDEIGRAFDHLLLGRDEADICASTEPENTHSEGSRASRKSG